VIGYTKDLEPGSYRVFYKLDEVRSFDWSAMPRVKIIFQTTINVELFTDHVAEIRRRVQETRIADTICYATKENQDALRELCHDPSVDAIVVIGGKHSKNTKELARIAEEYKPTILIGTVAELDAARLAGMKKVGISAGASTPDYDVEAVVAKLQALP
jgi:4-hydroxy-3-methylbut-2-enyl diphosphate reductase